jgi:hypothetical protein
MSTCQIEVVEFGESTERPWVRSQTDAAITPRNNCLCNCICPCNDMSAIGVSQKYEVSA